MSAKDKGRRNIVVNSDLAKELSDQYFDDVLAKKGTQDVVAKALGDGADPKDKFQVALHLREIAVQAQKNNYTPERSRQEIGAYLALVSQASEAEKKSKQALEDVENFKGAILRAELQPGQLTSLQSGQTTSDALRRLASQQGALVGVGNVPQIDNGPFSGDEFGFEIGKEKANRVAAIAEKHKNYIFTAPPSQLNRNAVMDSVAVLKREARLAEAEFRRALSGKELSAIERKAIEKASPVRSSGGRNFLEWSGHNIFQATTKLLPEIFGKEAAQDPRRAEYLKLRDKMTSDCRVFLSTEELRRYLTGLKNQRNEFAAAGAASKFDLAALDSLIAETERKVVSANEEDAKKFAETLEKLNQANLKNIQDLDDKEASMAKFRMLQIALMASPFGLVNILGPAFEILGPIFDGNLSFGEGLAQGISNIPFFGDIADALKITDFFELFFDKVPLVSDVTGFINLITDAEVIQELGGAAGPGLSGSPLLMFGIIGAFSVFRADSEFAHMQESNKVEKDSKKALTDAFTAFRKGLSDDKVEVMMQDFMTKQLDVILKSFSKAEMVDFIAKSFKEGGEGLKIFDKLKIKYKNPASGVEEDLALHELKARGVDFGSSEKVAKLLFAGTDAVKVNKFVDAVFAYRAVEGNNVAEKLVAFAAIPGNEVAVKAKDHRDKFEKEKAVDYLQDKLALQAIGSSLDDKLDYCKKQAIDHEMMKWRRNKHLVPVPSPQDPQGTNVRDLVNHSSGPQIAVR